MNRPADAGIRPAGASWLALGLGVVAFVILVGLGAWQVQRLHWKEGLIASIEARVKSPPRVLSEVEDLYARTKDVDYTPVELSGRFLNDRESHFFATWKGESGFYVYTPLTLDDGRTAMVNRGFVPYDRKDPATRPRGQVEREVTITGLARNPLGGKPSWVIPENETAKNVFYWKDLGAMADRAGIPHERLLPFFVDAGNAPNPGGLPVGGVTMIDLPNNHLQYAFTWFGLAAALAGVFGTWLWRGRKDGAVGSS